jgi:hypothetical protein
MKSLNNLIAVLFAILLIQIFALAQSGNTVTTQEPIAAPTPVASPKNSGSTPPFVKRTELHFNYTYENLTNNYGEWHTATVDFIRFLSKRQVIYGTLLSTRRFGQRDRQITIGIYQPLSRKWTVQFEAGARQL